MPKKTTLPTIPMADWPHELASQWQRHVPSRRWSSRYERRVANALGLWLAWSEEPPTAEALRTFHKRLVEDLAPRSADSYCQLIAYGAPLLWPRQSWDWLRAEIADLQPPRQARPQNSLRPRKRRSLPFAEWPAEIRRPWEEPRRPLLRSLRSAPQARWSEAYRRRIMRGVGRYLGWLGSGDLIVDRPTIRRYVEDMHAADLAPITIGMYLEEVAVWTSLIWRPKGDWEWLKGLAGSYKHERPRRDKSARTASTHDLVRLGRRLMTRAQALPPTTRTATLFRDGLMIGLLALRPIRLSNLANLRLGESLVVHDDGATIVLGETKNGRPYSAPVPDDLVAHLHRYIEVYRPVLLGGAEGNHLWIGRDGRPLSYSAVAERLRTVTRREIGRAISPQFFRHSLATTAWATSTEAMELAPKVLGHRDPRTTETHYQIGAAAAAARALQEALEGYQKPKIRKRPV